MRKSRSMKRSLIPVGLMMALMIGAIVYVGLRTDEQPRVVIDDFAIFETRPTDSGNESGVYRLTADGVEPVPDHPLTETLKSARNVAYAPKKGWVFFDSTHAEAFGDTENEWAESRVVGAALDGKTDPVIIGVGGRPDVSPDEKRLIFATEDRRIWIHELETGETIETPYSRARYTNLLWVTNSDIIFQRVDGDDYWLVRVNVDTDEVTDLGDRRIIPKAISPDRKHIACWKWRQNGVFIIDTTTNDIETIYHARFFGNGSDFVWASNSEGFYFHHESLFEGGVGSRNLYYCDLDRFEQTIDTGFRFDSGVALGPSAN